ncbi:MAG: cytochrome c oxidase subunit 3 [Chloroflexota bacterium]
MTSHESGSPLAAAHSAHPADAAAERTTLLLGVRLFILSEVMLFGAFFAAYFVLRFQAPRWPPQGDIERPELLLVGFNTLILLTSSVTMQWATSRIARGDTRGLRRGLAATLVLGVVFLAVQGYEFATNGFGFADGIFGSTFYTLTGFHGAHVLAGILIIGAVANRARLGLVDQSHHTALEAAGLYWHFVDVVWVFLFVTVYVL